MRGIAIFRTGPAPPGLTAGFGTVVVHDHAQPRPLEVVELARVHRDPERGADRDRQYDAQGDEEEEDVHGQRAGAVVLRRSAFRTTRRELTDMPTPAASGVTSPMSASGMTSRL